LSSKKIPRNDGQNKNGVKDADTGGSIKNGNAVLSGRLEFGNREQIEALASMGFYDPEEEKAEYIVERQVGGASCCNTIFAASEEEALEKAIEEGKWYYAGKSKNKTDEPIYNVYCFNDVADICGTKEQCL
jgi:hypothetical protein